MFMARAAPAVPVVVPSAIATDVTVFVAESATSPPAVRWLVPEMVVLAALSM
jgi:hypothetical protein